MIKILRGATEALTLKGVVEKDGRRPLEKDLGIIKKPVIVKDRKKILFVGTENQFDKFYLKNKELFKNQQSTKKSKASKSNSKRDEHIELDLKGGLLMPGFVESHTHSVFAGDRQNDFELRNQGHTYQSIAAAGGGIALTVSATNKAKESELLELAKVRAKNFTDQGVVLLESKSGYGLTSKSEIKAINVINQLKSQNLDVVPTYLGLHSIPKGQAKENYLKECLEKTIPYLAKNGLCHRGDIFVEAGYFDLKDLKNLAEAMKKWGWSFCVHADQLSHTGGVSLAVDLGAQSVEHCVEVKEMDIQKLAQSQTVANLLPAADFYLKMSYPPARKMIDAGAKVSIATDFNPGSSPTQSLNFVGVLARLEMKMTRAEVISSYTYNAASALGMEDKFGALLPSYSSKIIHIDSLWTDLFYQVGSSEKIKRV